MLRNVDLQMTFQNGTTYKKQADINESCAVPCAASMRSLKCAHLLSIVMVISGFRALVRALRAVHFTHTQTSHREPKQLQVM